MYMYLILGWPTMVLSPSVGKPVTGNIISFSCRKDHLLFVSEGYKQVVHSPHACRNSYMGNYMHDYIFCDWLPR